MTSTKTLAIFFSESIVIDVIEVLVNAMHSGRSGRSPYGWDLMDIPICVICLIGRSSRMHCIYPNFNNIFYRLSVRFIFKCALVSRRY